MPVAPRPTQYAACQRLHATLIELGVAPGHRIPRPRWDALVVQTMRCSISQARNLAATGEAAGLWRRYGSPGNRAGFIVLEPTADAAMGSEAAAS